MQKSRQSGAFATQGWFAASFASLSRPSGFSILMMEIG